ncbi:hypothetical protein OPV22_025042 [Ensete ventricosum]|uniref:BHLH domain-containing protein n=1 Tax=Ensete ventricosum TaxID=4639 RepID=A0AAV8Q2S3_ENSVE|nr:hypothetical protein OPV22_025042 [Ensete ventricosum]
MGSGGRFGVGTGNSGAYMTAIAEPIQFEEEIRSLIQARFDAPPVSGGSFTALLGLSANQAVGLLHEPGAGEVSTSAAGLGHPLGCSPIFPSNAALADRAPSFPFFTAADSPASISGGGPSPPLKAEPPDSDSSPSLPVPIEKPRRPAKRKDREKQKAKGPSKKIKTAEEHTEGDQLPYVHVRARRGQATDSHSLSERARREKINARMKLLQELVPGCSKITGTALVLDEIINHVQSLQRQVEFLSMRLAAVNPRIDFGGLDGFLMAECGPLAASNGRGGVSLDPASWSSAPAPGTGLRKDLRPSQQSSTAWVYPYALIDHATSLFGYGAADSVPLNWNQSKTDL